MDFSHSPALEDLRERVRDFINTVVIPREPELTTDISLIEKIRAELQAQAKNAGLFLPHMPKKYGGLGLSWTEIAVILEEAGRSLLGAQALNASAPDEGNMHLLSHVANFEQQKRYLEPLLKGDTRSCFSMTEPPPGAGSDPSMLKSIARRVNGKWQLEAGKWFISGADGAAFTMILTRANDGEIDMGATIFLLPMDTPGITLKRHIPTLDHFVPGGHCELEFDGVEVSDDNVLGEVGKGFDYAQLRLDPARLTHCMRWLGIAVRSMELAQQYALKRESFGKMLSEHQAIGWMVTESEIEIHAARLMIAQACWKLDRGERVRHEASMTKVFVSETVNRVVDRALQICGSLGVSQDIPISQFYQEVRPFRIYDGATEVHKMSIARRLFRRAAGKTTP
jgi:acyl-CoA dehydrogenase